MGGRLLVGAAMAVIMLVGWMHPATAQDSGIDFVVEPVPRSESSVDDGYFVIDSHPGSTVEESIVLRNDSGKRLFLKLGAVDATTGPYGGVSYGLESDLPAATGTWLTLDQTSVTLKPGESGTVGFEVEVPRGAESGEHLAGISVWSPSRTSRATETQQGKAGAAISVQTRRIVAVQINLPGPSQAELVISGVHAAARPDGLYLEIGIENAGRGLTKGEGVIEVKSQDFEQSFDVDTFVPRTAIAYPLRWTESAPEGEYEAIVEIAYEGGIATWEGGFTVGKGVRDELAQRGIANGEASRTPWLIVVLGAVALAGTALVLLRRWRAGVSRPVRPSALPLQPTPQRLPNRGLPPASVSRRVPPPPPPQASPPPPPPEAAGSHQGRSPARSPW